jgi:P4 family phage/plasmid primase-like protien
MKLLSSYLEGSTRDQKLHIWTGTGANGKSTLIELFEKAMGEYCCKLPITLLTKKRNASNAASPEIQAAKGKRFASLQEPDNGDKINVGYMKELSGGDKIYSRGLYCTPIEFKPQFKMLLTCNHLPEIPSTDDGTWRRLRVVPFKVKFTENPVKGRKYEKLKDNTLTEKSIDWVEPFVYLLTEYFKKYKREGIVEPNVVLEYTKEFKMRSDTMMQYFDENIETTNSPSDMIYIRKFYEHFKSWYRDTNTNVAPSYNEFKDYIAHKMNFDKNSRGVYIGIRYIQEPSEIQEMSTSQF